MADTPPVAQRNLVVCLDGTRNEPENGCTNVVRIFDMAVKDESQVVYYDPGVGTMGARSATTRAGKFLTQSFGSLLGHGIKDNIEEAYKFLMQSYRANDRIFVFGFSRGAYTALALAGMLRTVGLLRPHLDNLIPYAIDMYAQAGGYERNPDGSMTPEERKFWDERKEFNETFGNPDFPNRFDKKTRLVHFLGIWDTVKTVGWLNLPIRLQEAQWPFTRNVSGVANARQALAIDEDRRPYGDYALNLDPEDKPERARQMWFAGVHSDVGGFYEDDHKLSDIALQWIAEEAIEKELRVDEARFEFHVGVPRGGQLPDEPLGEIHYHPWYWYVPGRRRRAIPPGHEVHPSVLKRVELTAGTPDAYEVDIP
ncbi:MAG TPA: DUF2235 domain-containing protein [Actinomycetota bacterium]|nr:DUF2235 domain-containing protein [Actinomycetota bacterium]